ncbi:MAG: helix-turn-helix transcriptional regulator [Clostridiales bacterium]|nr:helix-turn-helix transcriptional regulator [Clostridiales bacterium]
MIKKTQFSYPVSDNALIVHIQQSMPSQESLTAMHHILSAMADPTRLKILLALRAQELCVYDLCNVLNMSQSAVSHQLRTLRDAHCVKSRRKGRSVFYSLDDEHVDQILSIALSHVHHK